MDKLKELRMTLVILVIGTFFISGCFFNSKHTVTIKTNGGSEIKNISVKNGAKIGNIEEPKKDGYVFDGWYLEGEEFDLDSKIDEDVTLVAKWIKVEVSNDDESDEQPSTTTTTAKTTKNSSSKSPLTNKKTSKVTKKTTKKSGTSTAQTNNKPTSVVPSEITSSTSSSATLPIVTEPTSSTNPTEKPDEPDKTEPTEPIKPTEPTKPGIDVTVPIIPIRPIEATNLFIEKSIETIEDIDGNISELETIKIAKTNREANFISKIDAEDLKKIVSSDMKTWRIVANNVFDYNLNLDELKVVNILELKGFNKVTCLTMYIEGNIYLFEYDEVNNEWTLSKANVSVGSSTLDIRYFSDLQKAVNNAKSMETVSLLSNIEVNETINIPVPIIFDGEGYEITKKNDYLFDIENIVYVEGEELIFNNMSLNVDSLIHRGTSKFDKITIHTPEGILGGVIIDKDIPLTLNSSNLLRVF